LALSKFGINYEQYVTAGFVLSFIKRPKDE